MSSEIESAVSKIKTQLEKLHSMVALALKQSMKAFEDLDDELADAALIASEEVEKLYHLIEEFVFTTISELQPKGMDLRRFIAYLNTSTALQKVGRYSSKIAKIVNLNDDLDHFKELESLPYLAELAISALEISIRAIVTEDLTEIDELEKLEAQSDNEEADMFCEIAEYLNRRRDISEIAMYYIIVGRYCERAADQAISIAEAANYMLSGNRVKLGLAYKDEPASLLD